MVPSWSARASGRADPRGGEQVVLAHEPQHATLACECRHAQPGPDLAVTLAVKGAGGPGRPDRLQQGRIRHRAERPGPSALDRLRLLAMAVDGRSRHAPDPCHPLQAVGRGLCCSWSSADPAHPSRPIGLNRLATSRRGCARKPRRGTLKPRTATPYGFGAISMAMKVGSSRTTQAATMPVAAASATELRSGSRAASVNPKMQASVSPTELTMLSPR